MHVTECKCKVKAVNVVSQKLCAGNKPKYFKNMLNTDYILIPENNARRSYG